MDWHALFLGLAPRIPLSSTEALLPVMRFGFWLNAVSGVLLVIVCWTGSVVSGRLLYYTFTRLAPSGNPF
jgi:hypothetical protein